jgi:hypothetical protein
VDRDGRLLAVGQSWDIERDRPQIVTYLRRESGLARRNMEYAAATDPDTNRGFSWHRRDIDSPEHTGRQIDLLKIEDDLFKQVDHGYISGIFYYWLI